MPSFFFNIWNATGPVKIWASRFESNFSWLFVPDSILIEDRIGLRVNSNRIRNVMQTNRGLPIYYLPQSRVRPVEGRDPVCGSIRMLFINNMKKR